MEIKGVGGTGETAPAGKSFKVGDTTLPSGKIPATMEGLHDFLIAMLGDEGKRLFDNFQNSIILMSINLTQHAAERAKQAAKEARETK